ncbi:MAG: flagellar basal body rod protein [Xanthobacteraceae bacterium]|nr:flagellar basal body rod protein [Xanthobacteraceae bacterium]
MENSLLIGLSKQMALAREMDVVSNNVANINTTGFKADGAVFQEFLMPVARANNFQGPDRRLSYVHDRATFHDFSPGAMQTTGNPLDVAIDGKGFMAVQTARGERYTRNGAFQISAAGELVTSEGDRVLGTGGPILFQSGDRDINIAADGSITVREGANANADSPRGKLRLVAFAQEYRLEKDGSSMFNAPQGVQQQAAGQDVKVSQGVIEKSNVKSVLEMSRLIDVTRSYTQIATMLQSESDLRKAAIDRLAEVPN